jgi:hypothetical protein
MCSACKIVQNCLRILFRLVFNLNEVIRPAEIALAQQLALPCYNTLTTVAFIWRLTYASILELLKYCLGRRLFLLNKKTINVLGFYTKCIRYVHLFNFKNTNVGPFPMPLQAGNLLRSKRFCPAVPTVHYALHTTDNPLPSTDDLLRTTH